MKMLRQALSVAGYNFRKWHKNPRVLLTFAFAFIMCYLLSEKAVRFAAEHNTPLQALEVFIWNFGDSNSILLSSLLLIFLFADIPFVTSGTMFYLVRTSRKVWIAGQILYICAATAVYLLFILGSTLAVCARASFAANMWSPTAAIIAYSGAGQEVALPALVKTLEISLPYSCAAVIFCLMLGYALTLILLMLIWNLRFGKAAGVVSVFVYSLYGFLMDADLIADVFQLAPQAFYQANVAVGWLSPLNHAAYHMHNFGYDLLPRLWETFVIFGVMAVLETLLAVHAAKRYNFCALEE